MASKTVQPSPLAMNLQRTFENAVRDVHQAGLTGEISRQRTPIAQRMLNAAASPDNARKQALSAAAKALAQLWKVVPGPSR
jgi:hypothetical protein